MDACQNPMIGTSEWGTSIDDFSQDWLLQNTVPTFQLESTFQPDPYEEGNRAPGKRPMSDSPTLSPNPFSDAYYEVSASKQVEPINTIMNHESEFERLVEDSWAYICKLYSRKRKSAEISSTKVQRNVRSRKPYQFVKQNTTLVVFGEEMDISEIPTPVCSCTGISRTCRGWTSEGWTSICCTSDVSMYPLPTYVGRTRIVRLPGRRMGSGTFTKVIEKLLLEGYDLDYPIDLKDHWVKLGTNKHAVIK